ncbi:hypothetical protein LCGC14_1432730 [marine sediment metagenome]|uniref:Uncharacterized protein n=1 Tax=marine sediment metagenome TaxID=412755 RepID=A0A0F9M3I8_9ZZZZ
MKELVWKNRVYTKNFVTDFFQSIKNIVGGRLKHYEKLLDTAISETWEEFKKDDAQEVLASDAHAENVMKAAEIELGGIDSVEDLRTLWRSYRRAPLREAAMWSCYCDNCKKRRSI